MVTRPPAPPVPPQLCGDLNAGPPSLQEMTLSAVNYRLLLQQFSLLFPLAASLSIHLPSFACGESSFSAASVNAPLGKLNPGDLLSF